MITRTEKAYYKKGGKWILISSETYPINEDILKRDTHRVWLLPSVEVNGSECITYGKTPQGYKALKKVSMNELKNYKLVTTYKYDNVQN